MRSKSGLFKVAVVFLFLIAVVFACQVNLEPLYAQKHLLYSVVQAVFLICGISLISKEVRKETVRKKEVENPENQLSSISSES